MKDLGENKCSEPWRKADAVMLLLCFVTFAFLGYLLANHILN